METSLADTNDRSSSLKKIIIRAGELHASCEPVLIDALLGSCVSVCLHDPVTRIGGMNHILLPGRADLKRFNEPARYGINAMEILINSMLELGARRDRLRAKVFGGMDIVHAVDKEYSPGVKNAEFVFSFLKTERIRIQGYNVGGYKPRRVFYNTWTSEVIMQLIRASSVQGFSDQERDVQRFAAVQAGKQGKILLFE